MRIDGRLIIFSVVIALAAIFLYITPREAEGAFITLDPETAIAVIASPALSSATQIQTTDTEYERKILLASKSDLVPEITRLYDNMKLSYSRSDVQDLELRVKNLDDNTAKALVLIIHSINNMKNDPSSLYKAIGASRVYLQSSDAVESQTKCGKGGFAFADTYCLIVVGGSGQNTYSSNTILLIDLAGDDIYQNNAGGAWADPISVSIDLQGDDTYTCESKCQGSGEGIGILIDYRGDDKYKCNDYCQGFGTNGGSGILMDLQGDDTYTCLGSCQGSGLYGSGSLVDSQGDDTYNCVSACQGAGNLGSAVLLDVSGNDMFECNEHCQGSGIGSIGLLIDYSGKDSYTCSNFWCQGFGYFVGNGIIKDNGGNDVYNCGSKCQGSGILGVGTLMDHLGNDKYKCEKQCEGFSYTSIENGKSYFASGVFTDYAGDDSFTCVSECKGFGMTGVFQDINLPVELTIPPTGKLV
jgi:hypothetical protein